MAKNDVESEAEGSGSRKPIFDPSIFRLDGAGAPVAEAGAGIDPPIAETCAGASAVEMVTDLHADAAEAVAEAIRSGGGRAAGLG